MPNKNAKPTTGIDYDDNGTPFEYTLLPHEIPSPEVVAECEAWMLGEEVEKAFKEWVDSPF